MRPKDTAESYLRSLDKQALRSFQLGGLVEAYLTMGALPTEASPTSWERLYFDAGPFPSPGGTGLQIGLYRDIEVPEEDLVDENPWSIGIVAQFTTGVDTGHTAFEAESPTAPKDGQGTLLEVEEFAQRVRQYVDAAGLTASVPDAIHVVVSAVA